MSLQRTTKESAVTEVKGKSVRSEGLPSIQLLHNGSMIQELSMDLPRLLIGRSDDNDISIPSRYVSQHHVLLIRHDRSTILIDLGSTNGTFVNSKRVDRHVMADDDIITIDRQSLFVQYMIKYSDPIKPAHDASDDVESADKIIAEALTDIENLLKKSDTELLPALSEDVPTVVGCIDDR